MSAELQPVWKEIHAYLAAGISVIPVRDKDDKYGVAKSPYGNWKQYQEEIIKEEVLFELMDVKYDTTAIGIIGGKVSGNLEILDIDVKYKPGIDATLLTDLKTLYPDIFKKLRIHKSPSGGRHILYRCESEVPGNMKLAGRKDENGKVVNFIETRGEGGYVLAPPSMGYQVVQPNPIPVLTTAERESIISLCRSYNEIIKVERPAQPTKSDTQYYDTNPFDDFNNRVDPTDLVTPLGWKEYKANNHFIWYTRPGKATGVSMSFNLQKRFFYCFTGSTELEENKGYSPSNLAGLLMFNGDKKKLYSYLVSNGYGKIKPAVEARIAKQAAINGKPLPANASEEAAAAFEEIASQLDEAHPYGTFWIDSAEHGIQIDRELLYRVADGLGFRLYNGQLCRVDDKFIDTCEDRYFFDCLKEYIHEEDADLYRDICNAYEAFIEKHGKFTISRLPILLPAAILRDTVDTAYKCYLNGILKITATEIVLLPEVPLLIWKKSVHQREYRHGAGGRYVEFLKLATYPSPFLWQCIGYLAHEYKDETTAYIILLTEEVENPKDGGGAGKNVFSELFKYTTSFTSKPGSQVKYDEKFMQSWNGEKIFCLGDIPRNFNFAFIKDMAGGTGLQKKLFKDESQIAADDMPKFLAHTNFSIEITDGGIRRRVKIIEFTDFFTKSGGIDVYFGVHFPKGWNDEDWAGFDTCIANCIRTWLAGGRKIGDSTLSETGWAKQFEQTYGQVIYHFIKENFETWVSNTEITNAKFKDAMEHYFVENNTPFNYRPSVLKINNALKEYCAHHQVKYICDLSKRDSNGILVKYKWFKNESETPF